MENKQAKVLKIWRKVMNKRKILSVIKFDLQRFTESGTDGGAEGNPDPAGTNPEGQDPDGDNGGDDSGDNKPELKYSDEDLDRIVNQKFAKWQKQKEAEIEEAQKTAKMTAAEKEKHEMEKLKEENEKLKVSQKRTELEKIAAKTLSENKIDANQDILDFVVGADEEETNANIKKLSGIIEAAVKQSETARATGKTPKNTGDNKIMSEFDKKLAKYN